MRSFGYDPAFDASVVRIFGSAEAADARISGIEWALSREDDFTRHIYAVVGTNANGTKIYALMTRDTTAFPSVVVVFSVSQNNMKVNFHDICLSVSGGSATRSVRGGSSARNGDDTEFA